MQSDDSDKQSKVLMKVFDSGILMYCTEREPDLGKQPPSLPWILWIAWQILTSLGDSEPSL